MDNVRSTRDTQSHRLELRRVDQFYLTVRTLIRCGFGIVVAYSGFGALAQFAGESTKVDLALSLFLSAFAEMKVVALLSLTGAACAWGFLERTLRHRKVEKMQGRIRELETMMDPNRSSSGLTPAGKTRPEDRGR
jgi:hypothetical protein